MIEYTILAVVFVCGAGTDAYVLVPVQFISRFIKGANEIVCRFAYSVQIRPLRELWELWDLHQSIPRVEIGFISKVIYILYVRHISPHTYIYVVCYV